MRRRGRWGNHDEKVEGIATIDRTALGIQDLQKRMDLWESPHTAPLQDIGGICVSPSTILRQTPKPNRIAGIKSGLVQVSVCLRKKICSQLNQDAISKTQPLPASVKCQADDGLIDEVGEAGSCEQ